MGPEVWSALRVFIASLELSFFALVISIDCFVYTKAPKCAAVLCPCGYQQSQQRVYLCSNLRLTFAALETREGRENRKRQNARELPVLNRALE